jgi:glutamate N-acetyltransferase/amino-acid N-acetyltransferase
MPNTARGLADVQSRKRYPFPEFRMTSWHLADGYRFSGVHCGIRPDSNRLDLAFVVSDRPATAAGVFTQNRVCAAPVHVCRERLPTDEARGVVICSGNANACTGKQGLRDAKRMTAAAAKAIGCKPTQMLVCSTGVIGRPLPMKCIEPGIQVAAKELQGGVAALDKAAHAILTTDTKIKVATKDHIRHAYRVTGFAKGAAMIAPNLATMLAFVLTDAAVEPDDLSVVARQAASETFNRLTIDGHTSTNDTVLFFANGSGPPLKGKKLAELRDHVRTVCVELAQAIAGDAEGASHMIFVTVGGLRNQDEVRRVAKAIAESPLVKTAIFGGDPNWGRILSAAGYAGVDFREEHVAELRLGDFMLYKRGKPLDFDAAAVSAYLKNNRSIHLWLYFSLGRADGVFWTSDLTYEYVRLNAEYTT